MGFLRRPIVFDAMMVIQLDLVAQVFCRIHGVFHHGLTGIHGVVEIRKRVRLTDNAFRQRGTCHGAEHGTYRGAPRPQIAAHSSAYALGSPRTAITTGEGASGHQQRILQMLVHVFSLIPAKKPLVIYAESNSSSSISTRKLGADDYPG
jgi:hypothetical protein